MKFDELRFGLDYSISEDFLSLPGNAPPRLWGQWSLSLYLQCHTRRKSRVGCFAQVMKINAVLLLGGVLKRRKAWHIDLSLETDFAWKECAQGKVQEEGEEVMLQASFLTSRVGLKLCNKVKNNPTNNKCKTFSFLRTSLKYPSDKK